MAMTALVKYGAGMPFTAWRNWRSDSAFRSRAHAIGTGEARRRFALARAEGVDSPCGAGRRDAQRRHRHADSEAGARPGRRPHGNVYQRHSIDLAERKIALYFSGWKHAGENLADVLKQRESDAESPIQMCDALSRNTPKLTGVQILLAYCLSHGRRQFTTSPRTSLRSAVMCSRRWAKFTATIPGHGNSGCLQKRGCCFIRNTVAR